MKDLISQFASGLTGHTELRAQCNKTRAVGMLNGNLIANSRADVSGVSARVYEGGVYGFASSADYDEENVKRVLESARENALFLHKRVPKGKPPLAPLARGKVAVDREYPDLSQKDAVDFIRAAEDYLKNKYPQLQSRTLILKEECMEKLLVVSDGTGAAHIMPTCFI